VARRAPCRLAALGIVTGLGSGIDLNWQRLCAGDQSRFQSRDDFVPGRSLLVAAVQDALPEVPASLAPHRCRNNAMTLAALRQIEPDLERYLAGIDPARVGVVIGTSTAGASAVEQAVARHLDQGRFPESFHYEQAEFGGASDFVAAYLGVSGPRYTISTACSSGARALATARSLLALGLCDAVVAGGTDTLCGLVTNGFTALHAVSDGITNPCSPHRSGLTLGEGSALFLVTSEEGGIQLRGVGESSEAHHMSAPDPSGRGAETAMRTALADAGVAPDAIAYLNLHGTGAPQNDSMECAAVAHVFPGGVPCSSTKPLVGHTLGAAGAIEAAVCWLALSHLDGGRMRPPVHRWDGVRDPELPDLPLVGDGASIAISGEALVMTNSFGFGGNNCTLVLGMEA